MGDITFVRREMLPPQDAPGSARSGAVRWARENLFSGWLNTLLTAGIGLRRSTGCSAISGPGSRIRSGTPRRCSECRQIIAGDLGRGRQRRLLRGDPRALEAVPVRLLSPGSLLAADAGLHPDVRRAGADPVLGRAAQDAVVLRALPRRRLLAALGRLDLRPDRDLRRLRGRLFGLHRLVSARALGRCSPASPAVLGTLIWWFYLAGPVASALGDVLPLTPDPGRLQAVRRLHAVARPSA